VIKHVLELFIYKTEIKICFERWLFLSMTGNEVLTIFHTKQVFEGEILMSTHASVLVDSVGPPSAEVCRTAASFP
jgi:hypothetical protein